MTPARLFFMAAVGAASVRAQSTVDLCPLDTQAGQGTNFATAMSKGGTVRFAPACTTVHLTRSYVVSTRIEIVGDNRVTLDATTPLGTDGMFVLTGNSELILNQITINPSRAFAVATGHDASHSRVTLSAATIIGPAMGGVMGVGTMSAVNTTFTQVNTALSGDNVSASASKFNDCAVGILSSATAAIDGSTFSGGSQAIVCEAGTLDIRSSHFLNFRSGAVRTWCATTIANSEFRGNHADVGAGVAVNPPQPGGGLPRPQSSSVAISATNFVGNVATGAGGALSVKVSPAAAPQVTLRHIVFDSNRADSGGALDLGGYLARGVQLDASAVLFRSNTAAHDGGGMAGSNVSGKLERGVFLGNTAGGSGGAATLGAFTRRQFTFANSLFAGNSAASGSAFSGSLGRFVNSTVARNQGTAIAVAAAPPSPLVPGRGGPPVSAVSMANSIVSENGTNCAAAVAGLEGPVIIDEGHNTQFPDSGCNPAIPTNDPQLDSLFVPARGNAALTAGDNSICVGPDVHNSDVWGQFRPRGPKCSIGAIEGAMDKLAMDANPGMTLPVKAGDFSLSADPTTATIADATSIAQYTVSAALTGGFSGEISYGVTNVPSGMSAMFGPVSGNASQLTISSSALVTPGNYTLTITGASGAITRSVSVLLVVDAVK